MTQYKKVVCGALWFGNKMMLGQRLETSYSGFYATAGGSVDATDKDLTHAIQREILEECDKFIFISQFQLIDCIIYNNFKTFWFEVHLAEYLFKTIKNTEPKKHGPWQLFTIKEAMKLPLTPATKIYLQNCLTKKQSNENINI